MKLISKNAELVATLTRLIHAIIREHFVLFDLEAKLRAQSGPDITEFLGSARNFGMATVANVHTALNDWIGQARANRLDVNDRGWLWRDALLRFRGLSRYL